MRTLTWTSPTGTVKTTTIGGTRRRSWVAYSRRQAVLDGYETFLREQRTRVAQKLQAWYVDRNDGMNSHHIRTETLITRRA